jgi:hypothetical protein
MPRFNSPRDVGFFRQISSELVDDVVETPVVLYKLNVAETSYNLYGESLSKQWYQGYQTFCLIERQDTVTNYEFFGSDVSRTANFRFNKHTLEKGDFYPEVGDLIYVDDVYYEVSNVRVDQWVGGLNVNKFSIICETFMTRKSAVDLDPIVR